MADDDYEVLPHQILSDLKFEVEALKKKLTQPDSKVNELILEIESMKDSIQELNAIFQKALEESKQDVDLGKMMQILTSKLDNVVSQNEVIAKGMIAISDKLEDFMNKQSSVSSSLSSPMMSKPMQRPMGGPMPPSMGMPPPSVGRVAPMPMEMPAFAGMASSGLEDDLDLPPPPPKMGGGRKGFM